MLIVLPNGTRWPLPDEDAARLRTIAEVPISEAEARLASKLKGSRAKKAEGVPLERDEALALIGCFRALSGRRHSALTDGLLTGLTALLNDPQASGSA